MATARLLIDTSILIEHLRKQNNTLPLMTLNTGHFTRIDALELIPPPPIST